MKRAPVNRSSLFLMELILAIMFFSLASAACLQLFVKSHLLSSDTKNLNMAINQASSATESITASTDPIYALSSLYPAADIRDHEIDVFYDKNWQLCEKEKAAFLMRISLKPDPNYINSKIDVTDIRSSESIYSLATKKHIAGTPQT